MVQGSMHERTIEIPTADGRMETFISYPEQDGPLAPVVIYMDVWGLREELYDIRPQGGDGRLLRPFA
jgi:carboxymethylenebutenolidase